MNTKTQSEELQSSTSSLPSLKPLAAPTPPNFPTFAELVEEDRKAQLSPQRKKETDLFDGILGDLTLLVSDYQRHPEKYGIETHDLLEQLMHGSKSIEHLTTHERRLLNLATFDYYQAVPPKKDKQKPTRAAPQRRSSAHVKAKSEKPRPGIDVPETELPAYWWLS